jgi:hypothetical protein
MSQKGGIFAIQGDGKIAQEAVVARWDHERLFESPQNQIDNLSPTDR